MSQKRTIRKYTLAIFLQRSREIHGDTFDYSKVSESDVQGSRSKISVICRVCGYEWTPTIKHHVGGKNPCRSCSNTLPWTYERFIREVSMMHDYDKFDYSKITKLHIKNKESKIPIVCRICDYEFFPTVNRYINGGTRCPECAGKVPWTLIRLISKSLLIHEHKYDYSRVTESHIINSNSKIPVICKMCNYEFTITINDHIYKKYGCTICSVYARWTFKKFLKKNCNTRK